MIDEKKLIEVLEDYKNNEWNKSLYTAFPTVVDDCIDFVENQPKIGGWIPCSERLPEENQNVIACFAHGTVTELRFYDKKFHGIYDYDVKVIVAWQPLPEAYHG